MLMLLSPSKTLDETSPIPPLEVTQPEFLMETQALVALLRHYTVNDIKKLMEISDKLAALNAVRYQRFSLPFTADNARPALLTFKGDVYDGMQVEKYKKADFEFAQDHLRILSGMYGLLRPLDLIQPYRLEMGIKLKTRRGKNLYEFWGDRITRAINRDKPAAVINLASGEYFKAVKPEKLTAPLIDITFKEQRGRTYKVIGLFAKKARGLMADFAIRKRLIQPEDLKSFKAEGYQFDPRLSTASQYVFVRKQ